MSDDVIVDALPYIDQGYDDPGVREAALHMVEEETRRFRPTKNYLEHLPPLKLNAFETEMMRCEFERMQQRMPMELLDMKRYELDPPPLDKRSNLDEWTTCINHSYASLQHQVIRMNNLELLSEYGCEAWRGEVELLLKRVNEAQSQLHALRKQVQEVNWSRKNTQMQAGEKIKALESQWVMLVSKNYEIELACVQLQKDINDVKLMKQRGRR